MIAQGVRPAALQKVSSGELAEFIAVCIQPKGERPRARQLLKAPYFDSIREKAVRCDAALSATTSQVRAGRHVCDHAPCGRRPCSVMRQHAHI